MRTLLPPLVRLVMKRRTPNYELQMALAKYIERVLRLTVRCFAYDIPEGSDFLQEIWPPWPTSSTRLTPPPPCWPRRR